MKTSMRILFVTLLVVIGHMSGCIAGYRSAMDRMNGNLNELAQSIHSKNTSAVVPAKSKPAVVSQNANARKGATAVNATGDAQVSIGQPAVLEKEEARRPQAPDQAGTPPQKVQSTPKVAEEQELEVKVTAKPSSLAIGRDLRGEYQFVSGKMDPKQSRLRIEMRVASRAKEGFSTTFNQESVILIVKGSPPIKPEGRFTIDIPRGTSEDVNIEFVIPDDVPELTSAKLRVMNSTDKKDLNLGFTRPAAPPSDVTM